MDETDEIDGHDFSNTVAGEVEDDSVVDNSDFIDMSTAVEVELDDTPAAMEEDGDMDDESDFQTSLDHQNRSTVDPVVEDMSKFKIDSHSDHVYAVAAYRDPVSDTLIILSGGGDDKAYLHKASLDKGGSPVAAPETLLLEHMHTDTVSCVAFNLHCNLTTDLQKTPKLCAVGAYDGAIVIYDPDSGTKLKEFEGPSDVEWLSFHPKGGSVLLAGSVADGTIWMYHVPTSKCMQVFVGHESGVAAGSFSPDGKWALSASQDGTLRVWAPRTGLCRHVFRTGDAGLTCLGTNGGLDGQLVIVGAEDGVAHVCHVGNKKIVASLQHYNIPTEHAQQDNENEQEMELPMSVEAVGFASTQVNPSWCATGGVDGVLKIWDLNSGQCRQICNQNSQSSASAGRMGGITRLRWHPTLPLVITALSDGVIHLWDARNGALLKELSGCKDTVNDLDVEFVFNEDESGGTAFIVCGSDDMTVRMFELNLNEILHRLQH